MLAPGTTVAGYRIDAVLGEGGMGVVYRATQVSLNRVVALKILGPEFGGEPGYRARFQREGQLQAALDHVHIVTVYEAGQTEHGLFLAMRLIDGPTLKELILSRQLDPRRSLRLLTQVAQALDAAHHSGLIHRDVKPQNILVGENDHAYLADFGLTRAPGDERLTGTGQFMGTIDYVAPEQIRGEPATAASDVYALAGVLFECLTGEVPFARPNEAATLYAHMTDAPPRPSERRPELPAALDDVLAKGLAKQPEDRWSSVSELVIAATRTFAAGSALDEPAAPGPAGVAPAQLGATRARQVAAAAPTVAAPETRPTAPRRDRRPVALALALLVAALAGGFVVGHAGSKTSSAGFANSASAGDLELSFPSTWRRPSSPLAPPGLTLSQPLGLVAARSAGSLVAGMATDAAGPTLLPAAFTTQLQGAPPAPHDAVLLGGLQAYRYAGLHLKGSSDALTVYVVPTSAGVASIACRASPPAAATLASCERIAATLRLSGASAYPLGPSAAYARVLNDQLARLRAGAGAAATALQAARTPTAQAAAATKLSQAYAQASGGLARATTNPTVRDANAQLAGALAEIATAYSTAASAARSGDGARYGAAVTAVRRGVGALHRAQRSLGALGYDVRLG